LVQKIGQVKGVIINRERMPRVPNEELDESFD
jgi:hypothetical protein